jgi:hypothetical protein
MAPTSNPPPASESESTSTSTPSSSSTPPPAPLPSLVWKRIGQLAFVLVALLVAKNLYDISMVRWQGAFDPWTAETDQKQIVQQFWGSYIDGAFPPGELLETYANVYNGPPFYALVMKALSHFMSPKDASVVVNIGVWYGALLFLFLAGRRAGSAWVGLAAVVLWAHTDDSWRIIAGGHPRSFAPLFISAFLWAWTAERRRVMLALLVLMGGTYPSVLIACGPVAAVVVAWAWLRGDERYRRKTRPIVEFALASMLALGFAKAQDLRAPKDWGSIITYEEALQHPAFQKGSRIPYTPFPPVMFYPRDAFFRLAKPVGTPVVKVPYNPHDLTWAWVAFGAIGIIGWWKNRKTIPYRELALLAGCFFAFVLARKMAFSMSLPHRAISHGWPVLFAMLFPVLAWRSFGVLRTRHLAGVLAFIVTAGVLLAIGGDGVANPRAWRSYAKEKAFYTWIQKNTPVDAVFAGNFQPMDEVPLFGRRRVYVNWKLAHPFRKGYFDLVTERTLKMYDAFYAPTLADVVRFAHETNVSYFVVDQSRFKKFERGDGQLFEPLRKKVQPFFDRCQKQRCALNPPPKAAVVFHSSTYDVIDIAKLAAMLDSGALPSTGVDVAAERATGLPSGPAPGGATGEKDDANGDDRDNGDKKNDTATPE